MSQDEFEIILSRAKNLCSKSEKCASDIYNKNKKWNLSSSDLEKIINTLKEEKFIDHQRYATAFANDKLKFNHWGKKKIKYALKLKFIEEEFIEEAINQIDENYYNEILEEEIAKKLKSLIKKDKATQKQKLIYYLLNKGFEYGKVFEFIENRLNR